MPTHASDSRKKIAYMMSRFPEHTETFVLYEILAVEDRGLDVEIYPFRHSHPPVMHPGAVPLVERAHYGAFLSIPILLAQLHFLGRAPATYFRALFDLLRATWGSLRFFSGAIALFPKAVHFARMMEEQGIVHLHAHFASHPAAAAFVIGRLTGIPYSFTAHGSDLHRDQHMLAEKVREAHFVVTISEYNREFIVEVCGEQYRDKVQVIHCGVDTEVFRPVTSRERGSEPFRIGSVGTLHEVKGQTYLIEACRILRDQGLDLRCHFVGNGPDRKKLEQQVAEAGLGDQVVFHGACTRDEVVVILRELDAMALPSVPTRSGRREGIPVVLMEAMASGVPVVASRISGIPELVEDCESGLLTPVRDSLAIAAALQRLADDPVLTRQLSKGGREKVLAEFDIRKNAAVLASRFDLGAGA